MISQQSLDSLLAEMAESLRELGIPLSSHISPAVLVNSRAKRRLGCCYYRDGVYVIEVSSGLLEQPERLRQTLAHELLHTCRGCRNHGEKWKAYAAEVNGALGYSIQRLAPAEGESQEPLRQEKLRYILECQSCGAKIYRSRMSKAVKYPWRYRCKCGGKLKRTM